jgi:hypothetical protein
MMNTRFAASVGLAVITLGSFSVGHAADACPAQVREAQVALASASRSEQDMQAPRLNEAGGLVHEAEAACKQGDMTIASRKAQDALGLLKSIPSIGHQDGGAKIPPSEKVLAPTHPSDADYYVPSPNVAHDPMFIGPTGRTGTGKFGFSAWIAPTTPVGNELAGGWRQQSGVPAIGFTFSWGGASRRPEPVQAP